MISGMFPKRAAVIEINHPPDLTVVGVLLTQSQFFYCVECAKAACRIDPDLTHQILFHSDIYPHSQACHQCHTEAVEGELGMSDKFWKPSVSEQNLQLLLEEIDNMDHCDLDSVENTLVGIGPAREQAITLVSIFDLDDEEEETKPNLNIIDLNSDCYDDDDGEPTRPCHRTAELLAACI